MLKTTCGSLIPLIAMALLCGEVVGDSIQIESSSFLNNGVTAHRGNSGEFAENTWPAFQRAIELGVDWIELDIFRTRDGQLVVSHDRTLKRVSDMDLDVPSHTYDELLKADVATDFRRRTGQSVDQCPPERIPLLEDVLKRAMQQQRTRVSIQPKMDCVSETIALIKRLQAERWVGFNDGSLPFMAQVKELAPDIPVFWDRPADTNIDEDLRIAKQNGFEALVLHHSGVTAEKVQKIKLAGLAVGAWTVNDEPTMARLLNMGIQRLYTDRPQVLLAMLAERVNRIVDCEGSYKHHLQGICADQNALYWSFTTTLVKTDLSGNLLRQILVANHHGDLCAQNGKLFVAVNLGRFNDPKGNADSWVYVYDADSLEELSRHEVQEVFHGAGGIGIREGHFFVVGGLPGGVQENYVYEYDGQFRFLKKHVIASGHTLLGIQTATFAHDRWWFGCYGSPKILLVTDDKFQMLGRYEFDCSLGIEGTSEGRLLSASGRCDKDKGCTGRVRLAIPDKQAGLKYLPVEQ